MTFLGFKYLKCIRIRTRIHLKSNVFVFEYIFKWSICIRIRIHDFTMYSYPITFVCIRPHVCLSAFMTFHILTGMACIFIYIFLENLPFFAMNRIPMKMDSKHT